MGEGAKGVSTLCLSICHVVGMCSEEQMGWVATRRIIAMVTNHKFLIQEAVRDFVCNAMCAYVPPIQNKTTISSL